MYAKAWIIVGTAFCLNAADATAQTTQTSGAGAGWKLIGTQKGTKSKTTYHAVAIDKKQEKNQAVYRLAAAELCVGQSDCSVEFWVEGPSAPQSPPPSPRQNKGSLAFYSKDIQARAPKGAAPDSGWLWSCVVWPRAYQENCL
jgi:hypothetical protein